MAQAGPVNVNQSTGIGGRTLQAAQTLPFWHRVFRVVVPVLSVTSMLVGGLVCIAMPLVGGVVVGIGAVSLAGYVVGKCIYDRYICKVPPTHSLNEKYGGFQAEVSEKTPLVADSASIHKEDTEDTSPASLGARTQNTTHLPEHWGEDREGRDRHESNHGDFPVHGEGVNIVVVEPDDIAGGVST